jgi:hypothetical protein
LPEAAGEPPDPPAALPAVAPPTLTPPMPSTPPTLTPPLGAVPADSVLHADANQPTHNKSPKPFNTRSCIAPQKPKTLSLHATAMWHFGANCAGGAGFALDHDGCMTALTTMNPF